MVAGYGSKDHETDERCHRTRWWLSLPLIALALFAARGSELGETGHVHAREAAAAKAEAEDEKPELSLRASPRVAFAPTEILFVAELRGGADDYEDLYCVTIEWDWDDDTRSETTPDCDPYEAGVSTIRRRYSTRHRFDYGGRYEVRLNLKKRDDTVASARTRIELRGGRFD